MAGQIWILAWSGLCMTFILPVQSATHQMGGICWYLMVTILIAVICLSTFVKSIKLSCYAFHRTPHIDFNLVMLGSLVLLLQAGKQKPTKLVSRMSQLQSIMSWNYMLKPKPEPSPHQQSDLHFIKLGSGHLILQSLRNLHSCPH